MRYALYYALCRLIGDRRGVTAIEYALIASLIGVSIIVTAYIVGTNLNHTFHVIDRHIVDPM